MILKKENFKPDKKIKPFIGILLFLVSIILAAVTIPLGFIYGIFYNLFTKGIKGIGEYCLKIAISIDQLGNVAMQHLINTLWITPLGYKFGNRDETISSALGRNKQLETLTSFGKFIDTILDKLDPNHSLNSIDYYIEPTDQIIDKLAWIHINNYQILSTRSKGRNKYYIPGGKREGEETDHVALLREIKEELNVDLLVKTLDFLGVFEAQADSYKPGTLVRMTCYFAEYTGRLQAASEIEEFVWLNYEDKEQVSEVDKIIFDYLHHEGLLK
ncbi:NUDIX domain-containing protein [Cellulophaga sp. Z1A5H]|uniref:NUDIX hydrolase n=1 Tax=unclassified Cellulophaga TaxID=2634405 RepID=UPI00196B996D|nr:NUDIX domain-containing protein [Cellulophaga sp. Z1A5H]